MQGEIISSDQQTTPSPLGDRLDEAIGETSSGIGALLSELLRRSLKTGVSDIGESLVEFAEEKVEAAVQEQMPGIAEAADKVAQSTSKRVVREAVDDLAAQSARQQQYLEAKIDAAESSVFDRARNHVEEVLTEVHESIDQTRNLAVQSNDTAQQKIEELRAKARQSWRKLKEEFSAVDDAHQMLRREHENLRENIAQVCDRQRQQIEAAAKSCTELHLQIQRLEERLAFLEQPRGIKGLIAKFRGGGKAASEQAEQQTTGSESSSNSEEPDD